MVYLLIQKRECKFDKFSGKPFQGKTVYELKSFCAIQLIREYFSGNKLLYYSYEINLIRIDGARLNVVDHGSLRLIRKDADLLCQYFGIPVWDVIDCRLPESALSR